MRPWKAGICAVYSMPLGKPSTWFCAHVLAYANVFRFRFDIEKTRKIMLT